MWYSRHKMNKWSIVVAVCGFCNLPTYYKTYFLIYVDLNTMLGSFLLCFVFCLSWAKCFCKYANTNTAIVFVGANKRRESDASVCPDISVVNNLRWLVIVRFVDISRIVEELDARKRTIRIHKSTKDIQHNGQKKKDKQRSTKHYTRQKTKTVQHESHYLPAQARFTRYNIMW